jgi:hypothetical protein
MVGAHMAVNAQGTTTQRNFRTLHPSKLVKRHLTLGVVVRVGMRVTRVVGVLAFCSRHSIDVAAIEGEVGAVG